MNEKIYKPQPVCATPAVQVGESVELINIGTLPTDQKKPLWRGIKQQNPSLADLMQNDEALNLVMTTFNAVFVMTPEEVSRYQGD